MVVLNWNKNMTPFDATNFHIQNIMGETKDRHRKGYYKEYAERTGKKDRHSADYYKKYRERKKLEKESAQFSTAVSSANSSSNSSSSVSSSWYDAHNLILQQAQTLLRSSLEKCTSHTISLPLPVSQG